MKTVWLRMRRGLPGLLLSMTVFVGAFGCGPGTSDDRLNNNPPVGVSGPAGLQTSPVARNATNSVTTRSTLSPPPGFSSLPKEQFEGSDHKTMTPDELKAQDRLNALNILAKQGFMGGDAPLIQALNDPDERVRARAQELMVEDWPVEIASGDQASK
jgi:hypothetical protein